MPPSGHTSSSELDQPWSSLGARGVNTLASKLLMSLLPPGGQQWLELVVDEQAVEQLTGQNINETQLEESFREIARAVMEEVETSQMRVPVGEALRQLVATGSALLHVAPAGTRVFRLDEFVVERDPRGNLELVITRESINPLALPDDIREQVMRKSSGLEADWDKRVDIFTCCKREEGEEFVQFQEVDEKEIPGSRVTLLEDELPWIPLRMVQMSGESYGRGWIEEACWGDLRTINSLLESVTIAAAASAKVVFLVDPGSPTDARELDKAPSGAIRQGRASDVQCVQTNKHADLSVAMNTIAQIRDRVEAALLLKTSIQRSGERVTAYELKMLASELDSSLAGIHSALAANLLHPLARRIIAMLRATGRLQNMEAYDMQLVKPKITVGIEALGRHDDLSRLDQMLLGAAQTFGPEIMSFFNMSEYLGRRAAALGLDPEQLIRSEEEVQQERQRAMQMQLAQSLGPKALEVAGPQIMDAAAAQEAG